MRVQVIPGLGQATAWEMKYYLRKLALQRHMRRMKEDTFPQPRDYTCLLYLVLCISTLTLASLLVMIPIYNSIRASNDQVKSDISDLQDGFKSLRLSLPENVRSGLSLSNCLKKSDFDDAIQEGKPLGKYVRPYLEANFIAGVSDVRGSQAWIELLKENKYLGYRVKGALNTMHDSMRCISRSNPADWYSFQRTQCYKNATRDINKAVTVVVNGIHAYNWDWKLHALHHKLVSMRRSLNYVGRVSGIIADIPWSWRK